EVEIGVASCVRVHRNNARKLVESNLRWAEEVSNCSSSDYETSPPSTIDSSSSSKKFSPSSYPAITARDLDIFDHERDCALPRAAVSSQSLMCPLTDESLAKLRTDDGAGSPIRSP